MTIKKTVTQKVIVANQSNAQKSPGPGDTAAVRQNARKHGLLAKHLKFKNAEEEAEFEKLLRDFEDEYRPLGATESALCGEAAVCLWKLSVLEGWAMQDFADRRDAAQAIVRAAADNSNDRQLPFFTEGNGTRSAAQAGWDCHEVLIQSGTSDVDQDQALTDSDSKSKSGHLVIEAKLTPSIETTARYQAAVKKDFYRAIDVLRELQRERVD
jgi:hypothetical protein